MINVCIKLEETFRLFIRFCVFGCVQGLVAANDPEVQIALKFAMDEYNKASSDIYLYKVTKVIRVQRKVGYQYTLTVIIARTLCKKGSVPDWCPVFMDPDKAKSYQCKFVVHNNGWLGRWVMVEQRCS
uniref:Cystatin domain-containing protein n=1 Tax=Oryzias latipes TaxID=8090 RepID=A0A3P9MCV8_ORYLA